MISQRYRPVVYAVPAIFSIWLLAAVGYRMAASLKWSPDKVGAYAESVDFARLTGPGRDLAIRQLEGMIGDLSLEEREQVWPPILNRWIAGMSPREKSQFLEATALPGFKQTPGAFDQLPPEQRQRAMDERLEQLRAARAQDETGAESALPSGHGPKSAAPSSPSRP